MNQEAITSPYVDFTYYKEEYGGVHIKTEKDFRRAEKFAEAFVNQITFGKVLDYPEEGPIVEPPGNVHG